MCRIYCSISFPNLLLGFLILSWTNVDAFSWLPRSLTTFPSSKLHTHRFISGYRTSWLVVMETRHEHLRLKASEHGIDDLEKTGSVPVAAVRVFTYNVLSSSLCEPEYHVKCKPEHLDERNRFRKIIKIFDQEIEKQTIICLQV